LITPFLSNQIFLNKINDCGDNDLLSKNKKIILKQSYLILTWVYYFSFLNTKKKNKIKISILPVKKKLFTLTKAPMAHKKNSKEQYNFIF